MDDKPVCFFAYSANPPSLAETIELAIDEINGPGNVVSVRGWKSVDVTGRFIINEVCAAIDACDLFACDVTGFSKNVLFELGYAIARDKRVWTTLNCSYPGARRAHKRLSVLSTIGRVYYHNSEELTGRFFSDQPFGALGDTIFKCAMQSVVCNRSEPPILLYLKSEVRSDASIGLTRWLEDSGVSLVIDDPLEGPRRPLAWYVGNSYHTHAAVVHLGGEGPGSDGPFLHNAKCSLVSGMAYGFGKPVLMLAHAPFNSPVDYRDLLQVHETAEQCLNAVGSWLPSVVEELMAAESGGELVPLGGQGRPTRPSEKLFRSVRLDVTEAQTSVRVAYDLFCQEYVRPRECDEAIQRLRAARQRIRDLSVLLNNTWPLPHALAPLRDSLLVVWYSVDEQVQELASRINRFRGTCLESAPEVDVQRQQIRCDLRMLVQDLEPLSLSSTVRM